MDQTVTLSLENHKISEFYNLLNKFGVEQQPPKGDFDVYRGVFAGTQITINHKGVVTYQQYSAMADAVDYAKKAMEDKQTTRNEYVVIAKHPETKKNVDLEDDHLNVWLTEEQTNAFISKLEELDQAKKKSTENSFEERVYRLNGKRIQFHSNGKIISLTGYDEFVPILKEVLEKHSLYNEYDLIIGQDEVGTGERIGPLVIAGVALTPEEMIDYQLVGIKDSKMVPYKIAIGMSRWITSNSIHHIWQMDPIDINKMNKRSVLDLVQWGHSNVLYTLLDKIRSKETFEKAKILVMVDQFDRDGKLFQDEKLKEDINLDVVYSPHAEKQCMSVAAASIMAKARRARWIELNEKVYNLKLRRKEIKKLEKHKESDRLLKNSK